jgi:hypothetical protein
VTARCAALLLVLGGAAQAVAQSPDGPETQVWGNLTVGKALGPRWSGELDVEPKWQVTGERWRALDLTPAVEHYPADWIDLVSELAVGNTLQRDGLDTFEVTPRVGARLHVFSKMEPHRPGLAGLRERLPLTRVAVSTLVRLEWRNLFYSDETPDRHQWRARARLEGKLALNRGRLSEDRTLYAIGDAEYYLPLGDDVPERYVNKARIRLGLGFRFSPRARLEALWIRDWNRSAPGAEAAEDVQAADLWLKWLF